MIKVTGNKTIFSVAMSRLNFIRPLPVEPESTIGFLPVRPSVCRTAGKLLMGCVLNLKANINAVKTL